MIRMDIQPGAEACKWGCARFLFHSYTSTLHTARLPFEQTAVILHVPGETAVRLPFLFTTAIFLFDVFHFGVKSVAFDG